MAEDEKMKGEELTLREEVEAVTGELEIEVWAEETAEVLLEVHAVLEEGEVLQEGRGLLGEEEREVLVEQTGVLLEETDVLVAEEIRGIEETGRGKGRERKVVKMVKKMRRRI